MQILLKLNFAQYTRRASEFSQFTLLSLRVPFPLPAKMSVSNLAAAASFLESDDKLYNDAKARFNPKALWEAQHMGESPSQVYYHLGFYKLNDGLTAESNDEKCQIVLRDWPRKRGSQSWSRSSNMNPSEKVISLTEFVSGDFKEQLTVIFGSKSYEELEAFIIHHFRETRVKH